MKYKKNKLKLNGTASAMQGFYFLVKFGLVLIYILTLLGLGGGGGVRIPPPPQ